MGPAPNVLMVKQLQQLKQLQHLQFIIILGNGICPGPVGFTSSCTCATEMDKIDATIRSKHSDYKQRNQ